jgi:hypothetical protein
LVQERETDRGTAIVKTDLETEIEKEGVGTGHVTEREDDKSVIDPDVLLSAALPKRRASNFFDKAHKLESLEMAQKAAVLPGSVPAKMLSCRSSNDCLSSLPPHLRIAVSLNRPSREEERIV